MLLLSVVDDGAPASPKFLRRRAYVSSIEDSGKSEIHLRLSAPIVNSHNLKNNGTLKVEVQFQLNRVPICEMHLAVDGLRDLDLVYPNMKDKHLIPWTPGKQWSEELTGKLNPKQREAILAITAPLSIRLPPILIIGPYGTGKTFTMGQAIKMLLKVRHPSTKNDYLFNKIKKGKLFHTKFIFRVDPRDGLSRVHLVLYLPFASNLYLGISAKRFQSSRVHAFQLCGRPLHPRVPPPVHRGQPDGEAGARLLQATMGHDRPPDRAKILSHHGE
jgi:hypothetical protein